MTVNAGCLQAETFIKRYLEYARGKVAPRISERAGETLSAEYVSLREEVRCSCCIAECPYTYPGGSTLHHYG